MLQTPLDTNRSVHHGDDPSEAPAAQAVLDLGEDRLVACVARPAPAAHRDAFPGDRQPDDDLGQILAVVLGVPVAPEPARAVLGVAVGVEVFGVAFEVGAGGVEEQQVDFEVKQVGDGEEHRFLHARVGVGLHKQVHSPIRLIVIHAIEAGDGHVVRRPLGGGELRQRVDRPVRHEREQHPLHIGGKPASAQDLAQRGVDVQGLPQTVEQPRRPSRARGDQPQPVRDAVGTGRRGRVGSTVGVGFTKVAVDRAHQPAQPVGVQAVLPPQVKQHVRLRRCPDALVVGQGQVAHDRAVLVRPRGRPQVHDRT